MSMIFPRFNEFSPLFRLADEFEKATRPFPHSNQRSFAPKFDVKETKEGYELHGELPGIEQSNINIEWPDDHTLTISGHSERVTKSSNATEPEITEVKDDHHQPTVEDDEGDSSNNAVATTSGNKSVAKSGDEPRFWVTERSFGSFHRTFQFPTQVDHDAVSANLKNGVLSVLVPKAKAKQPRKVNIQ
jgi:HSP20 family molecular chaperone IbpA